MADVRAALRGRRIGLIGTGTMGRALLRGWLAGGLPRRQVLAADPQAAARRVAQQRFGVAVTSDNRRVAAAADVLVLAVKPQQMAEVVAQIAPLATPRRLVISIAAGMRLAWFEERLLAPVIRVMPNLPATVGYGFSALALGRRATRRHAALAQALFGAVGQAVVLPERHFDAITAVSGSGPAYLFYLVQAWEEAARALGLPAAVARQAVRQTLLGSVALLETQGQAPAQLIARVASKRGTTEAALRVLDRLRVGARLSLAVRAAANRSRELSGRSG
ncbi:MAG: pyrroline-5-carboxylate reductase [Candidatus Omnitrophica bacterium]|nr:pyrroline-5-carboxylate reductase [Candidatus Omnitrophota bacterium]